MKKTDVVRAWKDEKYRLSLSEEELAQLPTSPVGYIELSDEDLSTVSGQSATAESDCTCTCTCCTCCCCPCCEGSIES